MASPEESIEEELEVMYEERAGQHDALTVERLRAPLTDLALAPVVSVPISGSVRDAVDQMKKHHSGAVLVLDDEGFVAGLFTERDLVSKVIDPPRDWREERVTDYMTPQVEVLRRNQSVAYALNYLHHGGYCHLPVVDRTGKPCGMLSMKHVVGFVAEFFRQEVMNLPPEPSDGALPQHGG